MKQYISFWINFQAFPVLFGLLIVLPIVPHKDPVRLSFIICGIFVSFLKTLNEFLIEFSDFISSKLDPVDSRGF